MRGAIVQAYFMSLIFVQKRCKLGAKNFKTNRHAIFNFFELPFVFLQSKFFWFVGFTIKFANRQFITVPACLSYREQLEQNDSELNLVTLW